MKPGPKGHARQLMMDVLIAVNPACIVVNKPGESADLESECLSH